MWIDVIRFRTTSYLTCLSWISFPTASLINVEEKVIVVHRGRCIKWYAKERRIKLRRLRIHNGGCFETLNLLHLESFKMFTFTSMMSYMRKKTIIIFLNFPWMLPARHCVEKYDKTSGNHRLESAGLNALKELLFKKLGMGREDSNACLICEEN